MRRRIGPNQGLRKRSAKGVGILERLWYSIQRHAMHRRQDRQRTSDRKVCCGLLGIPIGRAIAPVIDCQRQPIFLMQVVVRTCNRTLELGVCFGVVVSWPSAEGGTEEDSTGKHFCQSALQMQDLPSSFRRSHCSIRDSHQRRSFGQTLVIRCLDWSVHLHYLHLDHLDHDCLVYAVLPRPRPALTFVFLASNREIRQGESGRVPDIRLASPPRQ